MAAISDIINLFDSYSRQARLYPAMLIALPIILVLGVCFPELLTSPNVATLATIAAFCGVLYLFSNVVRGLGKSIEPKLLNAWGGWPTTAMLRWAGPLDRHTLQRYHAYLGSRVPALSFPDPAYEQEHPDEADAIYGSAVRWLKEQCRGADYALVEKENAHYGFRRNTLGARPLAIWISVICLLFGVGFMVSKASEFKGSVVEILQATAEYALSAPLLDIALIVTGLVLAWWIWGVNSGWVRQAGQEYASALLANCDK